MGNAAHTIHPVAGQGFNLYARCACTGALPEEQQSQGADLGDAAVLQDYEKSRLNDQAKSDQVL